MATSPGQRDEDFEALFRALVPRARRVAERVLGDTREAEDAVAEAFFRLFKHWQQVRQSAHLEAWLLRVTANCAVDGARRSRRRRRDWLAGVAAEARSTPHEAVVDRLVVADAARRLPRREREVVVLRYAAGLSERDVADALGVAVTTVREHAHRGVTSLRASLGPDWEEAADAVPI